ncbi:cation:proton antiporter [Subtercola frigoramans]|uniref:CPA1 family monovalent cation:H+ antiporter n=1 Tax=Subtercola frigoramans TaxID=120298 RepID=A0ABS2L6U5_9MICO|nr:sodium:proton antiporter [Subtercola frigoramans]MBM7472825.1 CPA1 family monovalent cation:H+ antiporter [Subtercola frigoramans]
MRNEIVAIIGVIVIVGVSLLAPKLRIAAPIILVLIGVGISIIPGVQPVHVPSALILTVVLPPLLYASAINLPLIDFRRNIGSITGLSVALVFVSAFGTGLLLFSLFPELSLASAIALGAVISPTDAVAATSIGKRLGLPHRLSAVIEGESLVNDASALVLLRSAVAATAGAVSLWQIAGSFVYSVVVAAVVGAIVGAVTILVRSKLSDPVLTTAVSFAVPFLAYVPAESVGASGVLSVVAAGLMTGHFGAKYFTAPSRISERLTWRTLQFLLENAVFLIMGLQLKDLVVQVVDKNLSVSQAIYFGLLATGLLIIVRFVFVMPPTMISAWRRKRHPPPVRPGAVVGDVPTGMAGGVVLSWSGMRGVVTLAAAQSLPEETPYRPQLILIAFTVAIVTLIVQGSTLPFVIRLTGIQRADAADEKVEFASLVDRLQEAGRGLLENPELVLPGGAVPEEAVVERVRRDAQLRSQSAWEVTSLAEADETNPAPHEQYRELRLEVLRVERETLLDERDRGEFSSHTLTRAHEMLDLEESRLVQSEGLGG